MNWELLTDYGLKYSVVAGGGTVGVLMVLARLALVDMGLVALVLLGVAGAILVLTIGGSGTSTAAMANEPGQSTTASPDDAGVGSTPGRGVRAFFFALGLAVWSLIVLAFGML